VDLQKVILYYAFTPLDDPEAIRLGKSASVEVWAEGRILISTHGITAPSAATWAPKKYVRQTKSYAGFKDIVFKWSDERAMTSRLRVRVRGEVVSFAQPVSSKWTRRW